MQNDKNALAPSITVPPGEERRVAHGNGSGSAPAGSALAIIATQEESSDDGGSQSPLGTVVIGSPGPDVRVEFDIRDGTAITVPSAPFEVLVRNLNGPLDPAVTVACFRTPGPARVDNTRTFDIGLAMEDPNVRVPAFAHSVVFDHGLPDSLDYRALLSDSATGETYGLLAPLTRYPLNARCRFVRFLGLPSGAMGTVTFFLRW